MYSTATRTVYADISSWQRIVTDAYPEPMLAFRADFGSGTDPNAAANWAWCRRTPRVQVALAYVVLIPGHEQAILGRLKRLFGATPPTKLAVMIDMESGSQFAGPGNHSKSGNLMADLLAGWLGDRRRVVAYANNPDYRSCWPQISPWLKPRRVTASYGSIDPGTWGHQFYGGMSYPVPAGMPRSIAPFGGNVDLNVTRRGIAQVATDLGIRHPQPPDLLEQIMALDRNSADYKQFVADIARAVVAQPIRSTINNKPYPLSQFLTTLDERTRALLAKVGK